MKTMQNFIDLSHILQDIPQQMNGSDCGMFACKFSEYLSRYENEKHILSGWSQCLHSPLTWHSCSSSITIKIHCSGESGFLSRRPTCLSSGTVSCIVSSSALSIYFRCCSGGGWSTRLWRTIWCTHRQTADVAVVIFSNVTLVFLFQVPFAIYIAWRKVMV